LFKYFDSDTSTFLEKLFIEYFTVVEKGGVVILKKEVSIFAGHTLSNTRNSQKVENMVFISIVENTKNPKKKKCFMRHLAYIIYYVRYIYYVLADSERSNVYFTIGNVCFFEHNIMWHTGPYWSIGAQGIIPVSPMGHDQLSFVILKEKKNFRGNANANLFELTQDKEVHIEEIDQFRIPTNIFVTSSPKVWLSIAVEALESVFFLQRPVKWKSQKVQGANITLISPAQPDTEIYTTVLTKHTFLVTSYIHIITSMMRDA